MDCFPSSFSLLQQAAVVRIAAASILIAGMWLAIAWAVALP